MCPKLELNCFIGNVDKIFNVLFSKMYLKYITYLFIIKIIQIKIIIPTHSLVMKLDYS